MGSVSGGDVASEIVIAIAVVFPVVLSDYEPADDKVVDVYALDRRHYHSFDRLDHDRHGWSGCHTTPHDHRAGCPSDRRFVSHSRICHSHAELSHPQHAAR